MTFTPLTYSVTPTNAGANGTVNPSTLQTVNYGSSLTLTATPGTGYTVNSWSLDGTVVQTGGTTYTLTNITANHTISVTFTLLTYTVTPNAGANGTLSPSTAQTVNYGSSLTFTATPGTGYSVNSWSLDGTVVQSGGTTYTLTNITANHTINVTFTPLTYSVTPNAGANGTLSPSTLQTVNYGSSLTLTATPSTGYSVNSWSLDGIVVQTGGTTYTLTNITANHTVNVTFTLLIYSVTPNAGANGTVNPSTAQTVNYGSSLTLTATPGTGYTVNSWSLDGTVVQSGGTTYTLTNITANHSVNVTFTLLTYSVTPNAGANGTLNPSTAQTVNYGSSLTLTAAPGTGYTVNSWSLDGTVVQSGGTTYTLTNITANHSVNVTFTLLTYSVTPNAGANGTVSPSTAQTVNYGSSLTLTATPGTGYTVNSWSLDGTVVQSGGTTYTLTNITANHSVNVTFTLLTYSVTPNAGANGTLNPSTAQTVNYGSSLTFTAAPGTGYTVSSWSLDGTVVQSGGTTYTLTNITANHTVNVTFTLLIYSVTPSAGANGTVSPSTAQTVNYGSSLTLTAAPGTGYTVNSWSLDGTVVQTGGTTYTLTNIIANHSVQVTFAAQTFTVTPASDTNGSISPNTVQTVSYGSSLVFTALPNTGYMVNTWSVDGTVQQSGGTTFTLGDITASHSIQLAFISVICVTPVFSLPASIYSSTIAVALTTTTTGATIRYTTDGSKPGETNGSVYSAPLSISVNTTLKAIAYAAGMSDSPVGQQVYDIRCAAPTFSVSGSTQQSVTISSMTAGATIRYTLDGSIPSETDRTLYSNPVLLTPAGTLKAIAYLSGMTDSLVTQQSYIVGVCATPVFNLASSVYNAPVTVNITTTTTGATIRYTTDGSTPGEINGTIYSGALTISTNTTLKAIAYAAGMEDSGIAQRPYSIRCAAPAFTSSGGVPQLVTIGTATPGAAIRYTTDGSTPSETNGTVYSTPLTITADITLKAIAYAVGMTDSLMTGQAYTVSPCATPAFNLASSVYTAPISVTITTTTAGAHMRYTTDGSTPT